MPNPAANHLQSWGRMTIATASPVTCAVLEAGRFIVVVVASIAVVTGVCPAAVASTLIPVQLSMGSTGRTSTPAARKRMSAPTKSKGGLTAEDYKQLADAIRRLPPAQRKRLAKAMKNLTPEERQQLAAGVKQSLAAKRPASQAVKRVR
jgi:hypothetical protein